MTTKISLWVDDILSKPNSYTHHVKTYEEAIALLQTNEVKLISLDYDLGTKLTGYDIAKWIEKEAILGTLKPLTCALHAANPASSDNITLAFAAAYKAWNR